MTVWKIVAITCAGVFAGAINTIVGSGTLVTFPTLLAFGVPAVPANMSNTIGLVAGGITGTLGYRTEPAGKAVPSSAWRPSRSSGPSSEHCRCAFSRAPRSTRSSPSSSPWASSPSSSARGSTDEPQQHTRHTSTTQAGGIHGVDGSSRSPWASSSPGALLGGLIGARIGKRLNPWVLRGFVVVVGLAAIVNLLR